METHPQQAWQVGSTPILRIKGKKDKSSVDRSGDDLYASKSQQEGEFAMTVTDFRGIVLDWQGTEAEAITAGHNVDCVDCFGCFGCSGCSRCIDCYGCSGCSRCSGCSGCFGCSRCIDCSCCIDCSGCSGCSHCSEQPNCITTEDWPICIRKDGTMNIGCQDHPIEFWMSACDEVISAMHPKALKFWAKWKSVIERIVSCGN